MTIELNYIFTWRDKDYEIKIRGTSLSDCTQQANVLLDELAHLGTATSPSEGQKGNSSFEMYDIGEEDDEG